MGAARSGLVGLAVLGFVGACGGSVSKNAQGVGVKAVDGGNGGTSSVGDSAGQDVDLCLCLTDDFTVTVPEDRVRDVASVTAIGPCYRDAIQGAPAGPFFVTPTGAGVCQVTVAFRSGEPDFVSKVAITGLRRGCCGTVFVAAGNVSVPEGPMDASAGD